MKTGAEIMLGAVERFGNFLPEENLKSVHDSDTCDCEMCRWADQVERLAKIDAEFNREREAENDHVYQLAIKRLKEGKDADAR